MIMRLKRNEIQAYIQEFYIFCVDVKLQKEEGWGRGGRAFLQASQD
jgi:hypothetical protein